jgi:hypothetical protein
MVLQNAINSSHWLSGICNGRLTLQSGIGVPTSDQLAKTEVFFTPYFGNRNALYDGSAVENVYEFPQHSIKTTDIQTGDTHNGTAIIDNLTDTSQFIVDMEVTGTGVGANAVIVSIDSATQVTVDQNSTADGTVAITFKVPASTGLDFYNYDNNGTPKLEMVAWTNSTTRATGLALNRGVDVKSGDSTRLYVGSGITTTTAGQIEDSNQNRLLWNNYNQTLRKAFLEEWTSHVYSTAAWRNWNNDATLRVGIFAGKAQTILLAIRARVKAGAAGENAAVAIGENASTGNINSVVLNNLIGGQNSDAGVSMAWQLPSVGYTYYQMVEYGGPSGSTIALTTISVEYLG